MRKNFNYKIVAPCDLQSHAELATTIVKQRLSINFSAPADLLKFYLEQLSYDVDEFGSPLERARDSAKKCGFIIFKCIRIVLDEQKRMVVLEWKSNPTSDAYADSVLATILRVDTEAKVQSQVCKKPEWLSKRVFSNYHLADHNSRGWWPNIPSRKI